MKQMMSAILGILLLFGIIGAPYQPFDREDDYIRICSEIHEIESTMVS